MEAAGIHMFCEIGMEAAGIHMFCEIGMEAAGIHMFCAKMKGFGIFLVLEFSPRQTFTRFCAVVVDKSYLP
jgi:hypothetical protein